MISVALLLSSGLGLADEQWQRSQLYFHLVCQPTTTWFHDQTILWFKNKQFQFQFQLFYCNPKTITIMQHNYTLEKSGSNLKGMLIPLTRAPYQYDMKQKCIAAV